jgi:hypothetical protein
MLPVAIVVRVPAKYSGDVSSYWTAYWALPETADLAVLE